MKHFLLLSLSAAMLTLTLPDATAQEFIATLRGDVALSEQTTAPTMAPEINKDLRQVRAYPEQPPIIPHKTENYQIDKNANKCITCHSRTAVEISQAPMVSVTHFMNRDGQVLASVSPRRYFCTQCHVSQLDVTPLVENNFADVDSVLEYLLLLEAEKN